MIRPLTDADFIAMARSLFDQYKIHASPYLKPAGTLALDPSLWAGWPNPVFDDLRERARFLKELAVGTSFKRKLAWVTDNALWETLVKDLDLFSWIASSEDALRIAVSEHGEESLIERTKYLTHMVEAFDAGDRFIVAKLAYGGSQ